MLKFNRKFLFSSGVSVIAMAALVVSVLVFAPVRLSAAEFFRSIDDLPLAPGLTEVVEEGVEFESPAGRIVTAVAGGDARPGAVQAFYRKALPSLGWSLASGGRYRRDGEILTIRLETAGKALKLRIRVVPDQQKATQ
ncbi:MAG: hypothetical protein ACI9JL_003065 [Paracoccaceae bacterium]|jgi:hypothetical protein